MLKVMLTVCYLTLTVSGQFEYGYYWKDYEGGDIPKCAVKLDANSDTYIGQVYWEQDLVPASVLNKNLLIATSNGYRTSITTNKNVKLLCSQFPENFVWVKANSTNFRSVPNMIPNGSLKKSNLPTYIGRFNNQGKTYIGILANFLIYSRENKNQFNSGPFEVLTYNEPKEISCGLICTP